MVLLVPDNKSEDDYSRWSAQIGKPSDLAAILHERAEGARKKGFFGATWA